MFMCQEENENDNQRFAQGKLSIIVHYKNVILFIPDEQSRRIKGGSIEIGSSHFL